MKKIEISKMEKRNFKWIYLFLLPSVIIFIMFYLNPIVTVFTTSLTRWDGFNAPKFIGLNNFIEMFNSETFIMSLKNLLYW